MQNGFISEENISLYPENMIPYQDTVNLLISKEFNFSEIELIMDKIDSLDIQDLVNIIKKKEIQKNRRGVLKC